MSEITVEMMCAAIERAALNLNDYGQRIASERRTIVYMEDVRLLLAAASRLRSTRITRAALVGALCMSCLNDTAVDCELADLIAALKACGVEVEG